MIDPDSGTPYIPTLYYFLGAFDIYDREETLGEELSQYDPNIPSDRETLVKNYCLPRYKNYSYKKKYLLFACLENALSDNEYNFQKIFEDNPEECNSLPSYWDEMENPRAFFENIYRILKDDWEADILKASKEDPGTW